MTATHDTHLEREHAAAFDTRMRQLHAASLARLSPVTVARLRADRHAALSQARRPRVFGWGLASATAAVFALAIGMFWLRPGMPARDGSPTAAEAERSPVANGGLASDALLAAEVETMITPLDEDPDLYLWLAANDDALPPIMER